MMEEKSKIQSVIFQELSTIYTKDESITCCVSLKNFRPGESDRIGLFSADSCEQIDYRLVKEGSIAESKDGESESLSMVFKELNYPVDSLTQLFFKYLNADSEVMAESSQFEIKDRTISDESFLTIQSAESFDEATVLVNKFSSGKVTKMEEDVKKLYEQLAETFNQLGEQKEYCDSLEEDIKKKEIECNQESDKRSEAEKAVEELGRGISGQMQVIEEQGQRIESLERSLSRETKLNATLKEDIEGQRSVFEESLVENEQHKMKFMNLKSECKQLKKILQDERDIFAEESTRYEDQILHYKRKFQQSTAENSLNLKQAKIELQDLENKLELEKRECMLLQSNLKEISREYDDYVATADNEMQIAKDHIKDLELALAAEEERNNKSLKDQECIVSELQKSLKAEKKRTDALAQKYEEMQTRAVTAEKSLADCQEKLEKADRNMVEMEELVKGSKSELDLLKKTVSVEQTCIHKSTQSDSQIQTGHERPDSIESRSEMLLKSKSVETPSSKKKYREFPNAWGKPKEEGRSNERSRGNGVCSWEKAKEHTIHREVFNNNSESKRYNPRFYEKKRFGQQEDNNPWFNRDHGKDQYQFRDNGRDNYQFARPERQQGQLRQHRNSLLRENSRLRYTMSMLNHDCAILNYTLQQVVMEAEQKLEALYQLYLSKESQCAAYEQQYQGGLFVPDNMYQYNANVVGQYDPYVIQSGEYVEACPTASNVSYVQPGVVYQGNYTYCDGYYEMQPQQDNLVAQPVMMEPMQYVQPIYVS